MKRILLAAAFLIPATAATAQPRFGGPPPEARAACDGRSDGSPCNFTAPHGRIDGSCRNTPEGMACVPAGHGPGGPGGPAGQGGPGAGRGSERDIQRGGPPGGGMPPPQQDGRGPSPLGANIAADNPAARPVRSKLPDTGQGSCFDERGPIACPRDGQPYAGQDAQYLGTRPAYRDNRDGTVSDLVTGLTWQRGHNAQRLDWYAARQACTSLDLGGHRDWRLPGIRELFSIANFRGSVGRRPYLDDIFEIREPDASILAGDPFAATHRTNMMGQTWSATLYTGDHWDRAGVEAAFFMNFLDGHIKQAPTRGRAALFYRCVRGPAWGANDFVDNGDGTVTDRSTDLVWQQKDDGRTRDWPAALAYCEALKLAGHDDWRLPNVKELQSIVDYRRHDPALDTRFLHQSDRRAWFWSSTTHGDNVSQADYVCFGKCTSVDGVDVHGAGAQRSDPKRHSGSNRRSQGGQQDEIRIDNYVRCVR